MTAMRTCRTACALVSLLLATSAVFGTDARAQSPGFWEPRKSLGTNRQEVGAAVVNGLVYCAGGIDVFRGALKSVERYDPKTKKWSYVASMPTSLHHFGMAATGGKIYTIGGFVSSFTGTDVCSVYDPSKNKWSAIAKLPRKRGALGAVAINGKVYAVGGVVPKVGIVGDLTVFDPSTGKWATLAAMPTAREHLGIATLSGKLYVAGGRRSGNLKTLEVYDPKTNKWKRLKDMPTARGGNGAAVLNGKLIVVGGELPGIFRHTEEYDPKTNSWRSLELMTTGLHGIYPVTIGDEIMVPGGASKAGFAATNLVLSLRMLPDGVDAYGVGTAACKGAESMHVTHRPIPGQAKFKVVAENAPPKSHGFFVVGVGPDVIGTTNLGFRNHIDLSKAFVYSSVNSDAAGRGSLGAPVPVNAKGLRVFLQFVWVNTAACGGQWTISSSHGLDLTVR